MDILPCMWQQNKIENTGRYRVEKLSSLLSEMQAGNANQRKTSEYHSYQRAGRTDAEPIIRR